MPGRTEAIESGRARADWGTRARKEVPPPCVSLALGFQAALEKALPVGALRFTSIRPGLRREEGTKEPVFPSGKTSVAFVDESWDLL